MNLFTRYIQKLKTKPEGSDRMAAAIARWGAMYEDKPPWRTEDIRSLNLPAAISSELARMVTIEMRSAVTGSRRAEYLDIPYQWVLRNIRRFTEYACAKGGIVWKPYVQDGEVKVDFVQADCFLPVRFNAEGEITGAVFLDRITRKNKVFTRLEEHLLHGGQYTITNSCYEGTGKGDMGKEIPLEFVPEWAGLAKQVVLEEIRRPLFTYFKMPMANTVDVDSPLGVSVFARAEDLIRQADIQYSRLLWEFESGKRAIFVDESALRRDFSGKPVLPDKRLYRLLNTGDDTLFHDWSPQLREEALTNGLNRIFQRIEFNCGLAYGSLSDPQGVDKTAEEIRSSKQRSYAMVTDIQIALRTALEDLVYVMDVWCGLYGLAEDGRYTVSFDFDDSVITDRSAEFQEKKVLLQNGILLPWEFRAWYMGENEETAKKALGVQ